MLPDNVLEILIDSVLTDFTINDDHFLRQTLSQNTLLDWVPSSPTYLYHGLADDQVPHENSVVAYNTFHSNGASNVVLELLPESAGGHTSAAIPSIISGYNLMTEYMMINQKGDMDGDGDVSLIDQAYISAIIINNLYSTDFQVWLADLNYDEEINVIDILINKKDIKIFKSERHKTKNTHGTGCTLSSSVTTFLSCGKTVKKSCELGIKYVNSAIKSNPKYGKGHGPINHLTSLKVNRKFK